MGLVKNLSVKFGCSMRLETTDFSAEVAGKQDSGRFWGER